MITPYFLNLSLFFATHSHVIIKPNRKYVVKSKIVDSEIPVIKKVIAFVVPPYYNK
jgi:hypothetical protein